MVILVLNASTVFVVSKKVPFMVWAELCPFILHGKFGTVKNFGCAIA